jgi:hypothetical protein
VEDAYRAALAGTAPGLLKKATDHGFRLFVEGMFDLLTSSLNGCSDLGSATFSRQDVLEIIWRGLVTYYVLFFIEVAAAGYVWAASPATRTQAGWSQ